jgi:predicted GNAT family N-acyltransferase
MIVKVAKSQEDIINHFLIRMNVFIEEQNISWKIEWDEYDSNAVLFVGYHNNIPVSSARLVGTKVGRVATLKSYRGNGYASIMMRSIESYACKLGLTELTLNAQESSLDFYKKLGYQVISERFFEANIPHFRMTKKATRFDC